jgi:hypothetical protein
MTLMVEPSFRWDDDWYITEEAVVVTAEGYHLLSTPAPREIPIIGNIAPLDSPNQSL